MATAMCQFYTTIYLKSDPHMDAGSDSRRDREGLEREGEWERKKEREREVKGLELGKCELVKGNELRCLAR